MIQFIKNLGEWFLKSKDTAQQSDATLSAKGIILFSNTSEVIKAEKLLRDAGLYVEIKGPPPDVRTGCDMAIEFPLVTQLLATQVLKEGNLQPLKILPLQDLLLAPVSLFNIKEYSGFLMVRAASMKITVTTGDHRIVNISGGGCPDVPYLADRLVGKTLLEAREPRELGSTLCGYALQMAYEEIKRRCVG